MTISEYLAKGLPVVSGCTEDVFQGENVDFYMNFPNDSTEVDINKIIDFYHSLYPNGKSSQKGVVNRIREFAYRRITMKATFSPVIKYILGEDDI